MRYRKDEAKEFARQHMRGVWGASITPFQAVDLALDEDGFRANLRHWFDDLMIDGLFVSGKRGEFFSLSIAERKRTFEIAVEEAGGRVGTIMSCWDLSLSNTLDLLRHAQAIGADYAVVQSPLLYFGAHTEELIYDYYAYLCQQVDIGIALWNNADHGYVMQPAMCARLADLPNIVAIKDSVPRDECAELTRLAGDRLVVSNPAEPELFDNMVELGWQVLLATPDVLLMQTATDRRLSEYPALVRGGEIERARQVRDSLQPVRDALRSTEPRGKAWAQQKFWLTLLGQVGGPVRPPMLALTAAEEMAVRAAFEQCGLGGGGAGGGGGIQARAATAGVG